MMKKSNLNIPNCITILRVVGTLCLVFLNPLSTVFFAVYTLTGITDVLDGWIARKTGTFSNFGAKLDSIADLLFYTVMLIRVFPILLGILPERIWYMLALILIIRLAAYLTAAVKYRRFASLHTYLNKLTGGAVFFIPYMLFTPCAVFYCRAVCAVAAVASLEELLIHLKRQTYSANIKYIFQKEC